MAAIIELIVALVVEPVIGLLRLLFELGVLVSEFVLRYVAYVLIRCTKGSTEARDYLREHPPAFGRSSKQDTASTPQNGQPIPVRRTPPISGWIVLVVVSVIVGTFIVYYQIQQARLRQTRQQIRTLVKDFATTIRDQKPDADNLVTSPLDELDAWQRPLELFVDRWPVGTLVVVRSAGADGQTGTSDDLLAVDGVAPVGIPGFLKKAIKERLGKILGNIDLDQLPIDFVFDG